MTSWRLRRWRVKRGPDSPVRRANHGTAQDVFGDRLILVNAGGNLLDSKVVKHEVTHALAREYLVTSPRWVQEGLACYFETLDIDREKSEVTRGATDCSPPSAPWWTRVGGAGPHCGGPCGGSPPECWPR